MSRKEFIEANGATCKNWTWSWSFVNHEEKFIIFGAWDIHWDPVLGNRKIAILSKDWERSEKGRRQPGYAQALEHIRLVEEEGYRLKIFNMNFARLDEQDAPAKIEDFEPKLYDRDLKRQGSVWYAVY
jgi:5-methylcytosine-specific restriction protein A